MAAVSARALIGWRVDVMSFAQCGSRPQRSRSRCRSPVGGCTRTTGASRVGAMFHPGAKSGGGVTVPKIRRISPIDRKAA
jgi:hypothetical protein